MPGYVDFDAFDPTTRERVTLRLPLNLVSKISRYAPAFKLMDLWCVKAVTENPAAVYKGLRTLDDNVRDLLGDRREYVEEPDPEGLCFVGVPRSRHFPDGRVGKPPEGMTFAVFVSGERKVMDWDWLATDSDLVSPIGSAERFQTELWRKS
jgi:hypothetical protein